MRFSTTFATALLAASGYAVPIAQESEEGYTVIFNSSHPKQPHVTEVLSRLSLSNNHTSVRHVYNNTAFRGFHATLTPAHLETLNNMDTISVIERPLSVRTAATARLFAPWGLERISSASIALNATSTSSSDPDLAYTYTYADSTLGLGTDIYIIDTGIYTQHIAFTSRATAPYSFDGNYTDNEGHGTHVSGVAAGAAIGIASLANIIGVKALDTNGTGSTSNVLGGLSYAINAHNARKNQSGFKGSVINMSLESSGVSASMDTAILAAISAGIHVVVAAGNAGTDSCLASPATMGGTHGPAIAVGAVDATSTIASFSNTGACVDVYAPGEFVLSAWPSSPGALKMLSGTSMASPHVAGIVAYAVAGNETLANDVGLMKEWVTMTALEGLVKGTAVFGEVLRLANNGMPFGRGDGQDGIIGM